MTGQKSQIARAQRSRRPSAGRFPAGGGGAFPTTPRRNARRTTSTHEFVFVFRGRPRITRWVPRDARKKSRRPNSPGTGTGRLSVQVAGHQGQRKRDAAGKREV